MKDNDTIERFNQNIVVSVFLFMKKGRKSLVNISSRAHIIEHKSIKSGSVSSASCLLSLKRQRAIVWVSQYMYPSPLATQIRRSTKHRNSLKSTSSSEHNVSDVKKRSSVTLFYLLTDILMTLKTFIVNFTDTFVENKSENTSDGMCILTVSRFTSPCRRSCAFQISFSIWYRGESLPDLSHCIMSTLACFFERVFLLISDQYQLYLLQLCCHKKTKLIILFSRSSPSSTVACKRKYLTPVWHSSFEFSSSNIVTLS